MDESSSIRTPDTHRLSQTILCRLAAVKNQDVGRAIGKDESTVSRIGSGEYGLKINDLQGFLTALGLKVVDVNKCCVDREVWESYKTLAVAAMTNPRKLEWDMPE